MNSLKKLENLKIPLLMLILVILISYLIIKMFMKKNKESFVDGEMQASPEGTSNSEYSTPNGLYDFIGGNESQEGAEDQTIAGVAYNTATKEGKSYNTLPTNFEEVCESVENLGVFRDEKTFKDKLIQKSWVIEDVNQIIKLDYNNDSELTMSVGQSIDNVNPFMSFTYTISEFNSNSSWVKLQINMSAKVLELVNNFLKNIVNNYGEDWSFMGPFTVSKDSTLDSSETPQVVPQKILELISHGLISDIVTDVTTSEFKINETNLRTFLKSFYNDSVEDGALSVVNEQEIIVTIKDNQLIIYHEDEDQYGVNVEVFDGVVRDSN